jgi:hypothetical protein
MGVLDIKTGGRYPSDFLQLAAYVDLERYGTGEGLTFDEEKHIFTYNGLVLPSVTQILKRGGLSPDFTGIDEWYAQKGTYVHKATELYDQGILDEDTLDDTVRRYFNGWKGFRAEFKGEIVAIEKRLRHPVFGYAGILDRIISGDKSYIVYLSHTGGYSALPLTDYRKKFNVFVSAINTTQWKEENGT